MDFPALPPPAEAEAAAPEPVVLPPVQPDTLSPDMVVILAAVKAAQENVAANAAQLVAAAFAPAPGKWSKGNLRRVGLSALKAFVVSATAVAVAKNNALAGSNLDLTTIESILLAAGIAGGGAAAKVAEIFLEDN